MLNTYLLLGCNGFKDSNSFVYCNSVVNSIVDLSNINSEDKEKVFNFLENACGLFDAPCYDYNKCVNIINFLYRQFSIIDEDGLHKVQAFLRMHKMCGLYVMLTPKEDYDE